MHKNAKRPRCLTSKKGASTSKRKFNLKLNLKRRPKAVLGTNAPVILRKLHLIFKKSAAKAI
jgi:hypothetical protein